MELKQINKTVGFENVKDCYYCGTDGNIYTNENGVFTVKKPYTDRDGYKRVSLRQKVGRRKIYAVHTIICSTFKPNPHCKKTVNHVNHCRNNNRVENLEWATATEQYNNTWRKNMAKKRKKVILKDLTNCSVIVFPSVTHFEKYLHIHGRTTADIIKRCSRGVLYRGRYIVEYVE